MSFTIKIRMHNRLCSKGAVVFLAVLAVVFSASVAVCADSGDKEAASIGRLIYRDIERIKEPGAVPPPIALETPKPNPIEAPTLAEVDASIQRGVDFLMTHQEPKGAWGSPRRTKQLNIHAPAPGAHHGYQAGTTALALAALLELEALEWDDERISPAIDKAENWLLSALPTLRRASVDTIYNNWGHAYGIQALTRMLERKPDDADRCEKIRALIAQQIDMLVRYECIDGGWCYYDFDYHTRRPGGSTICFVTATVLVALREAHDAGVEVPDRIVQRGMASILRQRKPDYTYLYGEYLETMPMRGINLPAGSLGRSQACNIAMRHWGDQTVTDELLAAWLDRLFARNGWLDIGRKRPVPHESWFQVAGYFYYYGHYYAALCIEALPPEQQGPYQDFMARTMLELQETDGSWWDYPLYDYHESYGTGYALMTMIRSRRVEE